LAALVQTADWARRGGPVRGDPICRALVRQRPALNTSEVFTQLPCLRCQDRRAEVIKTRIGGLYLALDYWPRFELFELLQAGADLGL
jgi:hypothetical protein